jgi:tetratricopeptide (TPR) repeat protein
MRTRLARAVFLALALAISAGASPTMKPEVWVKVRSPNFLVVTNANEKQGRRVAYQFETIRAVFCQFFHLEASTNGEPVTIIAGRDEETLKSLLPEYWATRGSMHPAGMYVGSAEKNYVALRLDVTMNQDADEPYEPIYHEYVHYLTRRAASQLPLWLVEGLAEFYGNTRIEGNRVMVGVPSSSNIAVLRQEHPLPLRTLFAVNASSPYYHEENKASIFYAQSWVLTHFLITRDWRENTHRTTDFITLLGKGVAAEEASARSIGDVKTLEDQLDHYIGQFAFTVARMNAPPGIDAKAFQAEPASEPESLALRADFMARDRHYREAKEMLEQALKEDPKLAAAHEGMGDLLSQEGKTEEATKWYSQAVALNSQSCLANYFYAVSLLKGRLDDDAAAKAEASLRADIKIAPDFAPAYSALGWLLASRHKNLQEAYAMALAAVTIEPGDVHYRLTSAQVLQMMGRVDDAIRVARIATGMAKTMEEESEAAAVLSNAEQYQEFQKRAKEREEAFKRAQAEAAAGASVPNQGESAGSLSERAATTDQASSIPPVLRHRDDSSLGAGTALASGAEVGAHAARPELSPERKVAQGTIQEVSCYGASTLELTFAAPSAVMRLFTDNYFKIPYAALNFTPVGTLNPCTDIKGQHAKITYHPAKNQPNQGEILEVGLIH